MSTKNTTKKDAKIHIKEPKMYNVVLLNDDYTPSEFVVHLLRNVFQLSMDDCVRMMLEAHTTGSCIIGTYTHEICETKVFHAKMYAEDESVPCRCEIQEA